METRPTPSATLPTYRRSVRAIFGILAIAIAVVACGPDSDSISGGGAGTRRSSVPVESSTTATVESTTTTVPVLDRAKQATVRIVARGSFVDPEFGERLNAPGSGSGFLISEDGLAVTNNHVVTGAATLEVYVPGDDQPRNARVLGVSECNDLAVIDIDGDGYTFLDWRSDPISSGLEIRALGYPLGDAELTVLDGVISKENADGESDWASIDSVIETTADILPGNSGGPVIDEDGNVVGIVYAGNNYDQAFAIGRDVATGLIDTLTSGEDVESIGVNGYAVSTDDGALTGIWVASVESGSKAQTAGIQGGDIITRMEGLVLATDGTMSDYCDILRTKGADAPLTVEVLRFDTNTILRGTLPNPLEEVTAPGDEETNDEGAELALDAPFTDRYECVRTEQEFECFDDQGIVRVMVFEVPTAEVAAAWEALEGVWLEGDLYSKVDDYGPDWVYDDAPDTAVGRLAIFASNTSDMAPYVVQWTYDQAGYVVVAFLDESAASGAYDWWTQNA